MLIAAAVCPHPPLLVPDATGVPGPGDPGLERLRTACHQSVAALLDQSPDLLVVVGGDRHTTEYPPGAPGSLHAFGVPFTVGGDPVDPVGPVGPVGPPVLPLSLTIGRWLLERAARPGAPQAAWWGIASDAATAECLELGEKLAALAPRVALLAMGDGPGCRARGIPGAGDARADGYDRQVAEALAAADAGALAAIGPGHDGRLHVAGRAAWQVLAGAAAQGAQEAQGVQGAQGAQGAFDAELRYSAAPFEVTYYVASWRRRAR